jgi:hypothetical protein
MAEHRGAADLLDTGRISRRVWCARRGAHAAHSERNRAAHAHELRARRPRNSGPNGPERPPSTAISPARSLPFQLTSTHTMLDFGE